MKTKLWATAVLCGIGLGVRAQHGLVGEYFNGQHFEEKVFSRNDAQINFVWDNVAPAAGMDPHVFSVRWTGKIKAPETGNYLFRAHVDDGIRVQIGGKMVIDAWDMHDSERFTGAIALVAEQEYLIQVEYFNGLLEGEIQLFWQLPSEAPVFGGLLGYNDHLIESRFFNLPGSAKQAVLSPKPTVSTPKPVVANPESKPPSRPPVAAVKPTSTSAVTAVKPAKIAKDTLERYLPRNVLFVKSKSEMLPESLPDLDRLAGFLSRNTRYKLSIEGHTDRIGNAAKNLLLSEQRAQSVADYLVRKGVDKQRISAKGFGDTRPLMVEAPGVANPVNRRVEFILQE